jgi:hypothetical protein
MAVDFVVTDRKCGFAEGKVRSFNGGTQMLKFSDVGFRGSVTITSFPYDAFAGAAVWG